MLKIGILIIIVSYSYLLGIFSVMITSIIVIIVVVIKEIVIIIVLILFTISIVSFLCRIYGQCCDYCCS